MQRWRVLFQLEGWLETPMIALSVVWLVLAVLELTRGLTPALQTAATVIWVVFILDFVLRLVLAPDRRRYLMRNWLTALSLAVPALRVLRVARALRLLRVARGVRGLRLVQVVGTWNRSMRTLQRHLRRRHVGYVAALTAAVLFVGAAGMLAFERSSGGMQSYGEALWWTSMILMSFGTDYWPRTMEGRVLCVLLAAYAIGVFGYVTASLATFFLGQDALDRESVASARSVDALRREIQLLREEIQRKS